MAKILILDIETAPNIAYVWRFWKENISVKQLLENSYILSYAAKWLGSSKMFYGDCRNTKDDALLVYQLVQLLSEADIVVAHNGDSFDLPRISGRALFYGMAPPSPYKIVDTLKVSRRKFGLGANSLEFLAKYLKVQAKGDHKKFPGFELWSETLKGNKEAWEEMKAYNIQDVLTLEQVYLKMRPWMDKHPSVSVYEADGVCKCSKCASTNITWQGYAYTQVGKYKQFKCKDCGGWGRLRYGERSAEENRNISTSVVTG